MAKLNTKKASQTHRCIIFGPPKSGKSLLAGKLAEHYKIIWIDMENGHEVLFQLPEKHQANIELVELKDTRSYPIAIETCLKMVKKPVSVCEAHGRCSCMICKREGADVVEIDLPNLGSDTIVVFDSLTQLSNSAIANITKSEPDDYKMKTDDWGNLAKLMEIFLSHIQQAGYNVIVISHEVEAVTEGKKNVLVPVGGSRNSSRNVAKYFDHVIYAERKNRKHVLSSSTCHSTTILTGSRTNARLEDCLDNEGSLLPIFKPELYASTTKKIEIKKPTITVKAQAGSILARLNGKKNS